MADQEAGDGMQSMGQGQGQGNTGKGSKRWPCVDTRRATGTNNDRQLVPSTPCHSLPGTHLLCLGGGDALLPNQLQQEGQALVIQLPCRNRHTARRWHAQL